MITRAYARVDALRLEARALAAQVLRSEAGGTHQSRYERDVRFHLSSRRLAELADAGSGLCFGRVDRAAGDRLYIGRMAVADEHNEPLLVDWRAPAAEPFYRATAREPMGLTRRRHFQLRGRRLVGIEDDLLVGPAGPDDLELVGEAALLAALERGRTGRMGDIVATIQREQDEIIRGPLPGILVVQGGPGTGKTAVALHRAAYLLYTHRFPLERGGVLLVGPNRVFLRYIERVLPSLGEHTVVFATPTQLVPAVTVTGTDPPDVARVKGDPRMAAVVAQAVAQRQRALPRTTAVLVEGRRLTLTPAASARVVEQARRGRGPHNRRRVRVERLVLAHFRRQWQSHRDEPVTDEEWRNLSRRIRRDPAVVAALERMWPVLTPAALLHDLFGFTALIREAAAGVLADHEWRLLHRPRERTLNAVRWTEGDVALLDEAAARLGPLPARARPAPGATDDGWMAERAVAAAGEVDDVMRADLLEHLSRWSEPDGDEAAGLPDLATRTFSHLMIDEAQDLSPMQLRALARRCPSGSMTIVGDLGQASRPWAAASWDEVVAHLRSARGAGAAARSRPARKAELTVNYRTPAEVMDLAARVLAVAAPALAPPTSVRRAGTPPCFTRAPGPDALVETTAAVAAAELAAVAGGRAAVIVPDALVGPLRKRLGTASGLPDDDVLDDDLAVLPLEMAKGLEFDSIVVVEPAALVEERDEGLKALYVALTRTTRRLHVVHFRELPEPLS